MDIKGTSTIIWCPNLTKGQKIGLHLIHKRILLINLMVTAKSLYQHFSSSASELYELRTQSSHICKISYNYTTKLCYIIAHYFL